MPMWRCPHCGTPQHEAARCWVCHRSSTTCSTCRHFRRSLAATVGYCGLDRKRTPLTGAEHRGCWEPAAVTHEPRILTDEPPPTVPPEVLRLRPESRRPLVLEGFVPVELADSGPRVLRPTDPLERSERATFEQAGDLMPPPLGDGTINWADRDSLFGD